MSGAPYEIDVPLVDGATLEFSLEWTRTDGSPFPWAEHSFSYRLSARPDWEDDYGRPSGQVLSLGSGIAVDVPTNRITFTLAGPIGACRMSHLCLATETATGKIVPLFDGTVTITKGHL